MLIDYEKTLADKIKYVLDEAEYELNDGIGFPGKVRTFNQEERDDIFGITEFIRKKFDYYIGKGKLCEISSSPSSSSGDSES